MTPKTHVAVACKTSVTVWSKEGKLLMEHGKGMLKFAKWIAVRSTGIQIKINFHFCKPFSKTYFDRSS